MESPDVRASGWHCDEWTCDETQRFHDTPHHHQTMLLFLRRTGCITPPALGKASAWCSRIAASAASFLITFASLVLTVSCLLLSEGAWILKPAPRKWNCWHSRFFLHLWRKGRRRCDCLLEDPCRLIKQEEWWLASSSTKLSLCENLITSWLSSSCSFLWLLLHDRQFLLPFNSFK